METHTQDMFVFTNGDNTIQQLIMEFFMTTIKPKRGSSYFLELNNDSHTLYSFFICLSSKSDEDGEYKVLRSDFYPTVKEALQSPLSELSMYDFEDHNIFKVIEWNSKIVKSLSLSSMGQLNYVNTKSTQAISVEDGNLPNSLEDVI